MATSAGAGDRGGGWQQQERVKLGACVAGVVGSLLVYGVLQVPRGGTLCGNGPTKPHAVQRGSRVLPDVL